MTFKHFIPALAVCALASLPHIALAGPITYDPERIDTEYVDESGLKHKFFNDIEAGISQGSSASLYSYSGMDDRSTLFDADEEDVPVTVARAWLSGQDCVYGCNLKAEARLEYEFMIEHDEYRTVDIDFNYMYSLRVNAAAEDISSNARVWGAVYNRWSQLQAPLINEGIWFNGDETRDFSIHDITKTLTLNTNEVYRISMRSYASIQLPLGNGNAYAEAIMDPLLSVSDSNLTGFNIRSSVLTETNGIEAGNAVADVPAPGTFALLALGLMGLFGRRMKNV